jgi:hypothetical protein
LLHHLFNPFNTRIALDLYSLVERRSFETNQNQARSSKFLFQLPSGSIRNYKKNCPYESTNSNESTLVTESALATLLLFFQIMRRDSIQIARPARSILPLCTACWSGWVDSETCCCETRAECLALCPSLIPPPTWHNPLRVPLMLPPPPGETRPGFGQQAEEWSIWNCI